MKRNRDDGELAPRHALRLLFAALSLGALPLFVRISPLPLLLLLCCLAGRLRSSGVRLPIPPVIGRVLIAAVGFGGIFLSYGTFSGLDAGISVFLVLMSLKVVEARRPRDFQVLALLGFFLCLSMLFFSQDLGTCIYTGAVVMTLVTALVESHGVRAAVAWRMTAKLALQSLPLAILLFLLFPRGYFGMRFHLRSGLFAKSGMSERLSPGSVASVALSDEIAFRAYFFDDQVPPPSRRYWRGIVLWRGYGLVWQPSDVNDSPEGPPTLGGAVVRQQIILQPHGDRWLIALDRPASPVPGASLQPGGVLQRTSSVFTSLRYEVTSRPENRETVLGTEAREQALWLPEDVSARARSLAVGWRNRATSDEDVVEAALQFFRKGGFVYTLTPGSYRDEALDEFLFGRRKGFCEHYAAGFATLMRMAGIPSRVVLGYQGGELNRHGNYIIVRQSDAHAWCEVWLRSGWLRVDPTSVVAPARVTSGLSSFLESRTEPGQTPAILSESSGALGLREIFRDVRMAWDSVQYQWDLHVLNFDDERQRTVLTLAGIDNVAPPGLIMGMVVAVGTAAIGAGLLVSWRGQPRRDVVRDCYDRFCGKAAKAGVLRDPAEGPLAFFSRVSSRFPAKASEIGAILDQYLRLRYGSDGAAGAKPAMLRQLVRDLEIRSS